MAEFYTKYFLNHQLFEKPHNISTILYLVLFGRVGWLGHTANSLVADATGP